MEEEVKRLALATGFDIVGITGAENFEEDEAAALKRYEDGHMDGYSWYTKERIHLMNRPEELLVGAKSVISLAMSYLVKEEKAVSESENSLTGKIARYSWGDDYHMVIKQRLREFCEGLSGIAERDVTTRIFVDDGPMNDRAAANRAGVGWFGKNANILTASHGSWVFLAQVITDLELKPDKALKKNCGSCVLCIDDCPTNAIVAPYVVDNTRCISYLTIELKGSIPKELRPLMGDWVFGCDICQDVCPVNRKAKLSKTVEFEQRPGYSTPELVPILEMDDNTFRNIYQNSPIKRAKRVGLQRNACVALGNNGDPNAVDPLSQALINCEPLVRCHAAWALGRIGGISAIAALKSALCNETHSQVVEEIKSALEEASKELL